MNFTQQSNERSYSFYVSDYECIIYRFMSVVFSSISIISFILNIRFLFIDRYRLKPLVLNLIINSFILITFSLPYILIQSIKCYPIQSYILCYFQSFLSFTCGICVMYTISLLTLIQYIKLFYNSSIIYRIIEKNNHFLFVLICWLISLFWSLPPLINIRPGYMHEGKGFDCSLNWIKSDIYSRLYLFFAFIFIYFLPLFCLLYTNIHILITIRQLIYKRYPLIPKSKEKISIDTRHHLIDKFTVIESNRLKRLRIDRRFAQATLVIVLHYLLAWTPYTICGILRMFIAMKYIHYEIPSMILTISTLTAKMAVTGQSCIYFYAIRLLN
ncbi:unnamed protein product [Rotaria sordida]|uniref:G-protein coupled receptors family 1 profile domain-containing protein n=1 Tax=Rotaria sordida TaxID=392033 RepID=A0A818L098_9BILA|nr:unnamed protein product [Rotaria sordida]CAF3563672.1 unnamed protein product [Rotaria sordida]